MFDMISELWLTVSSLLWVVLSILTAVAGIMVFRRGARIAGVLLAVGGVGSFGPSAFWLAFQLDTLAGWDRLTEPEVMESLFPVVNGLSTLSGLLQTAGLLILAAAFCRLVGRLREVERLSAR